MAKGAGFDRSFIKSLGVLLLLILVGSGCGGGAEPPSLAEPSYVPGTQAGHSTTPVIQPSSTAAPQPSPQPAILEARRLTLEWPPTIRSGDSDVVRLTLEVDAEGNLVATAEFPGHEVGGGVVLIPNLYDTHTVLAEARLDMAGVQVEPEDITSLSLLPGEAVTFKWSVVPRGVGDYRGTVWLYLRFIPLAGGPESRRAIYSQTIDIESVNLLGLGGTPARVLGALGVLLGSILSLDSLISWIFKRVKRE